MSESSADADEQLPVSPATRLELHPLRRRADGADSVVIGRVETGDFVAVPPIAVKVIELLGRGLSVADVQARMRTETGSDVDVAEFAADLIELGFVASVDGRSIGRNSPPPVSFAWIQPRHVRWLLRPGVAVAVGAFLLLGLGMLVANPQLMPNYRILVWHRCGGLVLAGNVALTWAIIFLHELGHLLTARAAGRYGRVSLSTRLQFLAAQTDISGVWVEPRRVRVTVYLAGIVVNLIIATTGIVVRACTTPDSPGHQAAGVVVLIALLLVVPQLGFFMRTDLYFLLQDISGCRNLYADATAYLRYQASRIGRRRSDTDPTRALPTGERRVVRAYAVLLVVGTAACLFAAVVITYPALVLLVSRAAHTLAAGSAPGELIDAAATIVVVGLLQVLWFRAWWRRHRRHLLGPSHPSHEGGDSP